MNPTLDPLERIATLEKEVQELKASLPAHSLPPSMLIRLEELQEELEALQAAHRD